MRWALVVVRSLTRRWRTAETPFVGGNRVDILIDGGPFFDAYREAIEAAQTYVLVESYIYRSDDTGWRVATALAEQAKKGLEVALVYDSVGSMGLDQTLVEFLRVAGVKVLEFRPISMLSGGWPWSKRNHRKMLVADGRVGIVGGLNIGAEYDSRERGGENWRDTGARIEGPAVAQLDQMFRDAWRYYGGAPLASQVQHAPHVPGGRTLRFVGNYARRERAEIRRAYLKAIFAARSTIRLTNAYFSPDPGVLRAIVKAARRGVQVEIITAGATDVWPVLQVSRGLYGHLLRSGVVIYEWYERVLHAKTAVIDGEWSTIGSANFTHRAFLIDLEVNATIVGPEIGSQMDEIFRKDCAKSTRIDRAVWKVRPWPNRLIEWFFGLFRRLI